MNNPSCKNIYVDHFYCIVFNILSSAYFHINEYFIVGFKTISKNYLIVLNLICIFLILRTGVLNLMITLHAYYKIVVLN